MDPITPAFETVPDATVDAPAPDPGGVDGGQPAPDLATGAADVQPEPAAAPFDPSQLGDVVGAAVQQQLGPLVHALTPPPPEPPTLELDPFDDSYPDQLQQLVGQQLQQLLAPYLPAIEQAQNAQISQWVDSQLDGAMSTYKAPDGSDGDRQAVLYTAAGFRAVTGDDATAITAARDYMVRHDADVASKAVEQYKQSLLGDNGTQRDPAVRGAALSVVPQAGSFDEVLNRWETRQTA